MWQVRKDVCPIISITNAQNKKYWSYPILDTACQNKDDILLIKRKRELKQELFKVVADQTGKLFDPDILTIVWARRFAGYKRAGLLLYDFETFRHLVTRKDNPVQIIWAGKPYPADNEGIGTFNYLQTETQDFAHCAVLTGYELALSAILKKGQMFG